MIGGNYPAIYNPKKKPAITAIKRPVFPTRPEPAIYMLSLNRDLMHRRFSNRKN